MAENAVASIRTTELVDEQGPAAAIMVALDVGDAASAPAFVVEVATVFKSQRMLSPPTTRQLLVTLIGDMTAADFAERWRRLATTDPMLRFFMQQMRRADCVHGTREGGQLDAASLLLGGIL